MQQQLNYSAGLWCDNQPWSVLCLQEPGQISASAFHPHFQIQTADKWGSCIVVHSSLVQQQLVIDQHIDLDFCSCVLGCADPHKHKALVISAHLPTEQKEEVFYASRICEIREHIRNMKSKHKHLHVLLGMDANVQLPHLEGTTGPSGTKGSFTDGRACLLLDVLQDIGAFVASTAANTSHPEDAWTHLGTTGQKRMIDFVASTQEQPHWNHICHASDCNTDHALIWHRFSLQGTAHRRGRRTVRRSLKGWKPCSTAQQQTFAQWMHEYARNCTCLGEFAHALNTSCRGIYHETLASRLQKCQPTPPAELVEAQAALTRLVEAAREQHAGPCAAEQRRCARRVMQLRRKWHDDLDRDKADRRSLAGQREDSKKLPSIVRHDGAQLVATSTAKTVLNTYFGKLFNPRSLSEQQYGTWKHALFTALREASRGTARIEIPMDVIQHNIMRIREDKATGIDGLPGEAFKSLRWETVLKLRELFEGRANDEDEDRVHWGWYAVQVWCIPKTPRPQHLGEWRPVSLLSSLQKLYASCVSS